MGDLKEIMSAIVQFRDERDWQQFHNAKDLALAVSIEAAELNELFLWKSDADADLVKIKNELADILMYALLLAHEKGIDIKEAILNKLEDNAKKYPVEKAKGNAKKYNEL